MHRAFLAAAARRRRRPGLLPAACGPRRALMIIAALLSMMPQRGIMLFVMLTVLFPAATTAAPYVKAGGPSDPDSPSCSSADTFDTTELHRPPLLRRFNRYARAPRSSPTKKAGAEDRLEGNECPATAGLPHIPQAQRKPVFIIPPMTGSFFDVKLQNVQNEPHYACPTTADWESLWPPPGINISDPCDPRKDISCLPSSLYPLYADCWAHSLTMDYDVLTGTTSEPLGMTVRLHTTMMDICEGGYMCICRHLDAQGWNISEIGGIPYDWRGSPMDWRQPGAYYDQLKAGIEALSRANGKKVALLSFSMGGPTTSVFLSSFVSDTWKAQYIDTWLSYSGVFGGVQKSVAQQISTYTVDVPVPTMLASVALPVLRTWVSQTWMAASGPPNEVLVNVTGSARQYRVSDLAQLYTDCGAAANAAMANTLRVQHVDATLAPGVPVHVVYALGHATPATYEFPSDDYGNINWQITPTVYCVDGDSDATADSLEGVPTRWQAQPTQGGQPVWLHNVNGSHDDTTSTEQGLAFLSVLVDQPH